MSRAIDPTIELLLAEVVRDKMYGVLELKFEKGQLVLAKRTETIKPISCRDSRGDEEQTVNNAHNGHRC